MTNKALHIIENSGWKLKKINLSTNNLKGDILEDILKMNTIRTRLWPFFDLA
jgi:hypothetical protein